MAAAARFAERGRPNSHPNPAVAALIVRDGKLLSRGWTQASGRPHAEADALGRLPDGSARGSTIYVTLEPCAHKSERGPACADILSAAEPERVVIGITDPDPRTAGAGIARLREAGISVTLLDDHNARQSLKGYLKAQSSARPWVTLKLAVSLDGCIALADGTSQWITGEVARAHVHSQRARHDAILVGGGTWRADRPKLDVRLPGLAERSPARVLLTRGMAPEGVRTIGHPDQISGLSGVHYLYVEGGAETAASFLKQDLVDELHIYRAPILIGQGMQALGSLDLASLETAHERWETTEQRDLGSDHFTTYLRRRD